MNVIDLLWHLANLLAPAAGVGFALVLIAKMLWHKDLTPLGWGRLWRCGVVAGWAGLLVGLAWTGRDGKMTVHALTLLGVASGVWWAGFARPSRR